MPSNWYVPRLRDAHLKLLYTSAEPTEVRKIPWVSRAFENRILKCQAALKTHAITFTFLGRVPGRYAATVASSTGTTTVKDGASTAMTSGKG